MARCDSTSRRRIPQFPNAHHSGFVGKIDLEGLAEGEHSLVVRHPEPRRPRDGADPLVPTRCQCQARSIGSQRGIPGLAGPPEPVRVGPGPDADRRGRTSTTGPSSAWWSRSITRRRNT